MSLIGHWKLDENAANNVIADSSGNGLNGTFNDAGGSANTEDHNIDAPVNNSGLLFDGTDDYIDIPDSGSLLDLGTGDFSFSCWVNYKNTPTATYICTIGSDAAGADFTPMYTNVDRTSRFALDGETYSPSATWNLLPFKYWCHVVITYDRDGDATFWVNGIIAGTADMSSKSTYDISMGHLYLGGENVGLALSWLNGYLSNVRLYSHLLSTWEISVLYAEGRKNLRIT
jgi:hypothetical protein